MYKTTRSIMTKENIRAFLLGSIALFGTVIAQTSANACVAWLFEQPKIPESLVKID